MYLYIILFLFTSYIFRYTIFYYYITLNVYYNKIYKLQYPNIPNNSIISFNYKTPAIINIHDNWIEKDVTIEQCSSEIIIMNKNNNYIIYPNKCVNKESNQFIICEIIFKTKSYDITNFIKQFYVINNTILTRPFVAYIFYQYLNIHIMPDDTYVIHYIDTYNFIKTTITNTNNYKYII